MKKHVLAILLATAVAGGLAACNKGADTAAGGEGKGDVIRIEIDGIGSIENSFV